MVDLSDLNLDLGQPSGRADVQEAIKRIAEVLENGQVSGEGGDEGRLDEVEETQEYLVEKVEGLESKVSNLVEFTENLSDRVGEIEDELKEHHLIED